MSTPAAKQERFHFLDGLRGIASLMVVFHHAFTAHVLTAIAYLKMPFLTYLFAYFTQSGVNLFFVLSGVVLLRPYLRRERKLNVADYFWRRLKRIYPPYFFALIFAAFVVWVNTAYPTWYNLKGLRIKFSWPETFKELFIFNFDGVYYNLAWWSLGIELFFYMLVPLIIFVFPAQNKISNRNLLITVVVTLLGSTALQLFFTNYLSGIYSLTYNVATLGKFLEYPLCFLMGSILAAKDFTLRHAWVFMISGLVLICTSSIFVPILNDRYIPLLHSGYGLLYAGIVVLAFNLHSFRSMLDTPLMIWFGERSYSLFLVHFSVFYFIDSLVSHFTPGRTLAYGLITRGVGVPLALLLSMLLFHFVERRQARGLVTGHLFWPWQVRGMHIDR